MPLCFFYICLQHRGFHPVVCGAMCPPGVRCSCCPADPAGGNMAECDSLY